MDSLPAVSGLTAAGEGAVRGRRRARAAARRGPVRRPGRRRPRAGGRGRRLLPRGARRPVIVAASSRAVLPFPSHEVDPYRGLAPHVGVDVGPGARALTAWRRHGARRRRVGGGAAAARQRPAAAARRVDRARSRDRTSRRPISPSCSSTRASRREDPADEHGEFAVRGGIVDIFPAGDAQPVRLEFIGDTIESLRTYDPVDAAIDRADRPDSIDRAACSDDARSGRADDVDSATLFRLHLARAKDARIIVSERDEVEAQASKLLEQLQQSYERGHDRGRAAPRPPAEIFAGLGRRSTHASPTAPASRSSGSTTVDGRRMPTVARTSDASRPSRLQGRVADWVAEIRALRDEGETTLFVAATPGRAERTIELLKEYERLRGSGRARRGRAVRRRAGRGRQPVARLPAARRRPADLRRSRRLRGGAAGARAAPVGDQGVSLGSARSEGRRPRRPRRPRHRRRSSASSRSASATPRRSSSSCATPATTSCSFRSSGSISSRSTPARRGRRSIGSAAPPGSARRPESRRPCATWPRSC